MNRDKVKIAQIEVCETAKKRSHQQPGSRHMGEYFLSCRRIVYGHYAIWNGIMTDCVQMIWSW